MDAPGILGSDVRKVEAARALSWRGMGEEQGAGWRRLQELSGSAWRSLYIGIFGP